MGTGRNSLIIYLSFPIDSCGEYFLFYGLTDFMLYLVLAWRYGFFFLSRILSAFFIWNLGMRLASSHDDLIFKTLRHLESGMRSVHYDLCPKNWFSFSLFPLTGRCHFRFRVLANHLAFFLPFPGHWVQTSASFHSDPHSLLSPTGHEELTYITILS